MRIIARFLRCMKTVQPAALAGFDYPGSMLARAGGRLAEAVRGRCIVPALLDRFP